MTGQSDPFAHAESTANRWLTVVANQLGTGDHRVLRAWLHVVRDRLPVDEAAHLGAQLPELPVLRGMAPQPAPDPLRRRRVRRPLRPRGRYRDHGCAGRGRRGVRRVARPVLARSAGPCAGTTPEHAAHDVDGNHPGTGHDTGSRLRRLEHTVEVLAGAIAELAHGLEANPMDEPNDERAARAARAVHQLLLTDATTGTPEQAKPRQPAPATTS